MAVQGPGLTTARHSLADIYGVHSAAAAASMCGAPVLSGLVRKVARCQLPCSSHLPGIARHNSWMHPHALYCRQPHANCCCMACNNVPSNQHCVSMHQAGPHAPTTIETAVMTSRASLVGIRYANRACSATESDWDAHAAAPMQNMYFAPIEIFCAAGAAAARLLCCCCCAACNALLLAACASRAGNRLTPCMVLRIMRKDGWFCIRSV
jgi:hypothetical protein